MPIQLTTPISPGDLDPGQSYTHVKVDWFALLVLHSKIEVVVSHGSMSGPTYTKGAVSPVTKYVIEGADFTTMTAAAPNEAETIYDAAGRKIYEWLIAEGYFIGTIV